VFKQSLLWAAGVYEFKCHEGNFIMNENVKTPSLSQLRYQARKLKYKLGSRKGGAFYLRILMTMLKRGLNTQAAGECRHILCH
jgi:hypothetical protein